MFARCLGSSTPPCGHRCCTAPRQTMIRLASLLAASSILFACTAAGGDFGDDADIIVGEDKEDGVPGVELTGFLAPDAPVDGVMTPSLNRLGYLVYAATGAKLDLEVT